MAQLLSSSKKNQDVSQVRAAAIMYKKGNYVGALQIYQHLAQQIGANYFAANIQLCKKQIEEVSKKIAGDSILEDPIGDKLFSNYLILNDSSILYPPTNSKFISYIAESVLQEKFDITSLGLLQHKFRNLSNDFFWGILEGLKLRETVHRRIKLLISGHDLRFVQPFIEYFKQYFDISIDNWLAVNNHNPKRSKELIEWADLVWCEWCCGNAVWYSKNIKENQKLIIRLHRFEIETDFPSMVNWENVNDLIFISDGLKKITNEKFEINCKQHVLYNGFDVDKVNNSFVKEKDVFSIAMIGYIPKLKRLDRSLSFYEKAAAVNNKLSFHIKGKSAEELPWVWNKEKDFFESQYKKINFLKNKGLIITQDKYGDDIHSWIANKGFLLSSSDIEASHQAVAEAMACGTIPLIFGEWVNNYYARLIYPSELCFKDEDAALDFMLYLLDNSDKYNELSRRVKYFAHENFNDKTILHNALRIINGVEKTNRYISISSPRRIVIFTDLNVNVIDGSSIWLMSLIEVLLLDKNIEIILILKEQNRVAHRFDKFINTKRFFVEVYKNKLDEGWYEKYVQFLSNIIDNYDAHKIIVRCNIELSERFKFFLNHQKISSLVYYVIGESYPEEYLIKNVSALLVQTKESKRRVLDKYSYLKSVDKIRILSPMIPDSYSKNIIIPLNNLIISYSGKLCRDYMAKEMIDFAINSEDGVSFLICAAKYNKSDGDNYIKLIKSKLFKLMGSGNALLFNQLERDNVINLIKNSHVGWSMRSDKFQYSSEISTKVLEYCSLGKPVLLNKHDSNIALLGEDYPLYCESVEDARKLIKILKFDKSLYMDVANHCVKSTTPYRFSSVSNEISEVL